MKYILTALFMTLSVVSYAEEITIDLMPHPAKIAETTDVITMETTAFGAEETIPSILGYVVGLEYPPMGDYVVNITNSKKFKKPRFSVMICRIKKYLEDVDYNNGDYTPLSTAFNIKGKTYNMIGFYAGANAYPVQNYQVLILNGKGKTLWNQMDCKIK